MAPSGTALTSTHNRLFVVTHNRLFVVTHNRLFVVTHNRLFVVTHNRLFVVTAFQRPVIRTGSPLDQHGTSERLQQGNVKTRQDIALMDLHGCLDVMLV